MSLCLSFLAFFALAFSMTRHRQQMMTREMSPSVRASAPAGWALLVLSPLPVALMPNSSIALTEWFGVLSVAAAAVLLSLTYRPRALPMIAVGVAVLLPVVALVTFMTGRP